MTIAIIIATLLTLIGVGGVRLAWAAGKSGRPVAQNRLRLLGWGLLAISIYPWMIAGGADRGVAVGIIVFMLAGLVAVGRTGWQVLRSSSARKHARDNNGKRIEPTPGSGRLAQRLAVFVLAGPLAGGLAFLLTWLLNALLVASAVEPANRLASELVFFPLAWFVLMMFACYDSPLRRRAIIFGLLFGVAGLSLPGVA